MLASVRTTQPSQRAAARATLPDSSDGVDTPDKQREFSARGPDEETVRERAASQRYSLRRLKASPRWAVEAAEISDDSRSAGKLSGCVQECYAAGQSGSDATKPDACVDACMDAAMQLNYCAHAGFAGPHSHIPCRFYTYVSHPQLARQVMYLLTASAPCCQVNHIRNQCC